MADLPSIDLDAADKPPMLTDDVERLIIDLVREESGKLITRAAARKVYEAIILTAVTETIRHGSFRLPQGWGQFVLRYVPATERLIFGVLKKLPAKAYVKYHEGSAVKELLGRMTPGRYQRKSPRPLSAAAP